MGSREKDDSTQYQPPLSSLVVRPTDSGSAGGGVTTGADGEGSDYEPGEVRRDAPPPYSRSGRFLYDHEKMPNGYSCRHSKVAKSGNFRILWLVTFTWLTGVSYLGVHWFLSGYKMHAGSVSPVGHRADNRYSPYFDHSDAFPRSHGYGSGRDHGRYNDYSPPYGCARDGARFNGRGIDRRGYGPGPFGNEVLPRNNPNVRPRERDWFCSDPLCNNLNFARREVCNSCKRPRFPPARSPPRRGYPPPPPPQCFPGPSYDPAPGRMMNGNRSPPRGWARKEPRDFRAGGRPYPRHEGSFYVHPLRRDRPNYAEDAYRERNRFGRPLPPYWVHRDRARGNFFNERRGYDRRPPSPPLTALPPRGQWAHDIRERSRSPMVGCAPPKDYRRDIYTE